MSKYLNKMPLTGPCDINIDEVVKDFDKSWLISQWKAEFTLCSEDIKVRITSETANDLMEKLFLKPELSPVFTSGITWKLKSKL